MDGWEEGVPDGKPASSRALRLRPARLEQSEPGWGGGAGARWLDPTMLVGQTLHSISINFLSCFLDFRPQTNLDVMTLRSVFLFTFQPLLPRCKSLSNTLTISGLFSSSVKWG